MLDRLLGRASLKERIEELEEEKRHLERRAEAEEERRSEAVADRQRAEERVNRLEDRIEELEDRVERGGAEEADLEFRRVTDASGERTRDVLDRLRGVSAGREGALTAFLPDGNALPEAVSETLGDRAPLARRAAPAVVVADDAGLVSAALRPPLSPEEAFCAWDDSFRLEEAWFRPTGRLGFGLIRADTFAVGTYEAGERVAVEGFHTDVMEGHSKGGFSQGRFARRREGQIHDHIEEAREVLEEVRADVDRLVLVGERSVLSEVRDLADATDVADATGDPEEALNDAFRDFWTTRVYGI
ncbi:Vms1/Ankzf1 family peptidyl-tRNA hydrolase [Haloparvum sedimenti]|uniref:Vms1/Ankzf1 family peptidyl-tRNA hydrolase n=1 Tax=Haloparvum sedimenti TaxID=1678448 RepID=UPI00071E84D6|nr:Vms1/Ankzf1 family peptidyl-tRNA hydrolase [Haloparvum sedimenti]